MVKTKSIMLLLLLFSFVASAQDVRLSAKTESEIIHIGSWIDVHVQGTLSPSVVAIAPVVKDSLGPFEVIKVERNGTEPEWLIRLTTIDSGKVFLPPVEFGYKVKGDTNIHKAYTNSISLNVSGTTIDPKGEIKDIKPPMSAPWLFEDFLPYLIGLVLIGAAVGAYYYYQRKKKQKTDLLADVKIVISSHREALSALRILEEKKLWQQGLVKEYYSEVTEIIRRFFERRWNIIALELTTHEILIQMKHISEAQKAWKEMETFFLTADLVKFAKYQPAPAEHEDEMRVAYEIVRAMTQKAPVEVQPQQQEVTTDVR
jgi:hypothetical protein